MTPRTSSPGGVVATPPGGELHPTDRPSETPVWDELADRWAELVDAGALVPLVLPELENSAGGAP